MSVARGTIVAEKAVARDVETAEIWRRTHERLLAFIRRRVGSADEAEDILQKVFLSIHANLHRVRNTESVMAWVYRIARNAIADYHRERARDSRTVDALAADLSDEADAPDADNGADEAAGELAGCLVPLMDTLPEDYRQAVALADIEGVPQTDAARKLGLSVSGMKSRVQRGRSRLKDALLDCCSVELDGRGDVVDYEQKNGGACGGDCGCGPSNETTDSDRCRGQELEKARWRLKAPVQDKATPTRRKATRP